MADRNVQIVAATRELAERLAPYLRAADTAEIRAASNQAPLEALLDSMGRSSESWALLIDEEPAAIWGVAPIDILGGIGGAWMLGSDALGKNRKLFLRLSKTALERILEKWPTVINAIDARYTASLRWAKWLGFAIDDPRPFGFEKRPFCVITKRNSNV